MITAVRLLPVLAVALLANVRALADDPEAKEFRPGRNEQIIIDATNRARTKQNPPLLKANPLLFEAAQAHSLNMAKKYEMNHILDGKGPSDRVKETGYRYSWVGENIAYGTSLGPTDCFRLWMNSPHHKENILRKE